MSATPSNVLGPVHMYTYSNALGPVLEPPMFPNFEYQAVPKLFSGPQKPLGLGPDPELTGY